MVTDLPAGSKVGGASSQDRAPACEVSVTPVCVVKFGLRLRSPGGGDLDRERERLRETGRSSSNDVGRGMTGSPDRLRAACSGAGS